MFALLLWGTALSPLARAESGGAFEMLEKKADTTLEFDHTEGWAYLISGGVALGISIPAYYLSEDVFAKTIYSITETISVASIGYGAYLALVDNDMTRFTRIVKGVPKLTKTQQNQLAYGYLRENADRARNVRKIRVISHALTAVLNFVNAVTASNSNLAEALYFVGGVNTLAAISFAVGKSDEEKVMETQPHAGLDFFVGPVTGLAFRF